MNPQRALLILGLHGEVTESSVREAYSKMVRRLYPDRLAVQDEDALKEAALIFREIHLAYEHLIS
jgi:DnaJ-class molecular chaperone